MSQTKIKEKKERGMEYFWLALSAFGGLGCEVILVMLEQAIYGYGLEKYTEVQSILHWCIICVVWGVIAFFIFRYARKELDLQIKGTQKKICGYAWILCAFFVVLLAYMNFTELGSLKPYHEFLKLGTVKFVFQHIYYLVETVLFMQIIIFGQLAFEKWFQRKNFPFGGIIVALTWGIGHIFTKGSLLTGIECMFAGFLFGFIYLLLQRDIRKTYVVLALAFIL